MKIRTRPFVLWSIGLSLMALLTVRPVLAVAADGPATSTPAAAPASAVASTNGEPSAMVAATNAADSMALTREMLFNMQRELAAQVAQHTAAITSSLAHLEPALDRIRQQQAESSATSNRTILIAAGLFAIAGFFGLGSLTVASVRAMGRFTDVAANAASRPPLAAPPAPAPSYNPVVSGTLEQARARFLGALQQLEQRIKELEHTSHGATPAAVIAEPLVPQLPSGRPAALSATALSAGPAPARAEPVPAPTLSASPSPAAPAAPPATSIDPDGHVNASAAVSASVAASHVAVQIGKGQALLNLDQVAEALECFDSALAEDPDNTDALLRKGMAHEKLQEWERALECYDRAIRLDSTLTVAYLYKGGVCNRLERHREALDSYEHALRSERNRPVASA